MSRYRGLRDEFVTILLAGHETTASTLCWTWYLVDGHPEVAEGLQAEATEVLGDRTPTFGDVAALRYTRAVIRESLRLFPPVWLLPRRAIAPDIVGGYRVPAGADVLISPYTLHRHPGFWSEPERFDPGRFASGEVNPAHRCAYIPFGTGPRSCIGSNFGMTEAILVAAMVSRKYRLRLMPGQQPGARPMLSLRPASNLLMVVQDVVSTPAGHGGQ